MKNTTLRVFSFVVCLFFLPCTALAVEEGQQLVAFRGNDLEGNPYDLAQIIGHKPVMLIFWASWCPSCITVVPMINKLVEKYHGRGMEFIGVNIAFNDSVRRAQAFARKTEMKYPALFDGSGQVSERYMLQGVPTIIIADKKGVIRFRNFAAPDISEATFNQLNAE